MHIRVFIPKIHDISTPFFLKNFSMVSQITFLSIVRPFSQRQWPYKGSPVCHVFIHSKELQSSDSRLLREKVCWLTYLWVRLFLLWKQSSVFSNCVGQNSKLSWGQLFLPVYWQLLCVCWVHACKNYRAKWGAELSHISMSPDQPKTKAPQGGVCIVPENILIFFVV